MNQKMPVGPMTNDTQSPGLKTADTLSKGPGIPTSATSDMPVIADPKIPDANAIDNSSPSADVPDTSEAGAFEGEADGTPPKTPGEEKDKTSPQDRAVIARERKKRLAAEARVAAQDSKIDQLADTVAKLVEAMKPKEDEVRPVRDNFETPEAYDKALETWARNQGVKVAKAEATSEQSKADRQRDLAAKTEAYNKRVDTFKKTHTDYEDLVYGETLFTNQTLGDALLEAEDGPDLAYYLAQNPEEHDRINALRPALVIYELGKISAKLSAPEVVVPKPKIPDPINPLRQRNTAGGVKDPNDMSMAEYASYAAQRDKPN